MSNTKLVNVPYTARNDESSYFNGSVITAPPTLRCKTREEYRLAAYTLRSLGYMESRDLGNLPAPTKEEGARGVTVLFADGTRGEMATNRFSRLNQIERSVGYIIHGTEAAGARRKYLERL